MPHSIRSSKYKTSKGKRRTRKKVDDAKQLSITSLLDILTILLVFLIKNVSMDAQNLTTPEKMVFPSTINAEKLIKDGDPYILKVYPGEILMGKTNTVFGAPEELFDAEKVDKMTQLLTKEAKNIHDRKSDKNIPILLIQADKMVQCRYIGELMVLAGECGFQQVYFSSQEDKEWLNQYARGL